MFVYSSYDAAQVFRKHSFLKYFREFDVDITVYPNTDNREENFIVVIKEDKFFKDCSFLVNAKKNLIYELDYNSTKKRTEKDEEFYDLNIKNEVDVSNKTGY